MREVENAMVIGDYYPEWVDATDDDIEEAAADIESRIRDGEMRDEFIEYVAQSDFIERAVGLMLSDTPRDEIYGELRELMQKLLTQFSEDQATQ